MTDEIQSLLILITLMLTVPVVAFVAFVGVMIADMKSDEKATGSRLHE